MNQLKLTSYSPFPVIDFIGGKPRFPNLEESLKIFILVVKVGCQDWFSRMVVKNGCQDWFPRLVVKDGCQDWLLRSVVNIGFHCIN